MIILDTGRFAALGDEEVIDPREPNDRALIQYLLLGVGQIRSGMVQLPTLRRREDVLHSSATQLWWPQ